VIPAAIAFRNDDDLPDVAHAVGEYSDRAFCGAWTVQRTDRRWPISLEHWDPDLARCQVCAALVYS
jgi:hypothetical protein